MRGSWAHALLTVILIIVIAGSSCINIVVNPAEGENAASNREKQAIDTLVEFSIVNQLAVFSLLEMFSDGFTKPLFDDTVVITDEDYNNIYLIMEELYSYKGPVMNSLGILVPAELAYESQLYACYNPPGSYIVPVYASPGILGSFLDFFSFTGGAGKRSRERIIELTKNCNEFEKRDLFDSLPVAHQAGAGDYNEWFQKLNNGDLDNRAAQIHNTFMNDPAYLSNASAKSERPVDVTYKDGAEMVTKGAKFYVDAGSTAVGSALPGFSSGMQTVQDLNDKVEKYKKYTETFYEKGMKETVKMAVTDKFDDMVTGQIKESLGEHVSDVVTHLTQQVTGKGKPSELVELGLNYGKAIVTDSDNKSKPQLAVALNKDDTAVMQMIAHVGDQTKPTIDLPQGGYMVVTADNEGNCDENKDVAVVAGKETVIAVNTQGANAVVAGQTGDQSNVIDKIQDTISEGLGQAGQQGDNESAETGSESGKSQLDVLKELQDAALAGLQNTQQGNQSAGTGSGGAPGTSVSEATPTNSGTAQPTEYMIVYETDVSFSKCLQQHWESLLYRECPPSDAVSKDEWAYPYTLSEEQARDMCRSYIYLTFKQHGDVIIETETIQGCGDEGIRAWLEEEATSATLKWTSAQLVSGRYIIGLTDFPQTGDPLRICILSAGWVTNYGEFKGCCPSNGKLRIKFKPTSPNVNPGDVLVINSGVGSGQ